MEQGLAFCILILSQKDPLWVSSLSASDLHPMTVTAIPPGGIAALKDPPNGWAHSCKLEERLAR